MSHYASVVLLATHILVLLPSTIPLSLHSICFLHCQLQIPHLFSVTNRANSGFTLGSLSFHIFSLGICILFFFLGAELMMTSPTSNQCCDTHSSPAMTLDVFFYIVGHIFATASNQLHSLYHQIHRWQNLFFCLLKQVLVTISSIASQNSSIH